MSTQTRIPIELLRDVAELGGWEFRESHQTALGQEGPAFVLDEEGELMRLSMEMTEVGLGELLRRPLRIERSRGQLVVSWDRRVLE